MSRLKIETNQKLLVNASTLLLLQNAIILVLIGISFVLRQSTLLLSLIQIITFGLDILGIALLGAGLYMLSKIIPSPVGSLFTKKSGSLLLFWVPLTLIWRLSGRFFSSQITQSLSTAASMLWVFFLASLVLTVAVFNLNKMIGRFREQGVILEGGGALCTTYAVLNVIGVFMLTLGLIGAAPFLEQFAQVDPNNPPTSFEFAQGAIFFVLLSSVGQFIKGLIVPILGLLVFSQLRGVFREMEFPSENSSQ